jgi:hypothetical protein
MHLEVSQSNHNETPGLLDKSDVTLYEAFDATT